MHARADRLPWYHDVDAMTKSLILIADAGIRCMPSVTTDFVIYANTSSPPPLHPTFLVSLLKNFVKSYPNHLSLLTVYPQWFQIGYDDWCGLQTKKNMNHLWTIVPVVIPTWMRRSC